MTLSERRGFTLLETMIVVGIVATLAAIALPSYEAYIKRSRILDAVMLLADARARMDDYFLDQRTYLSDSGDCGVAAISGPSHSFNVLCEATATTFLLTASGLGTKGMSAFAFSINHTGLKTTVSVPAGWVRTPDCWTIRKDGLCV